VCCELRFLRCGGSDATTLLIRDDLSEYTCSELEKSAPAPRDELAEADTRRTIESLRRIVCDLLFDNEKLRQKLALLEFDDHAPSSGRHDLSSGLLR
jgi:hypothetical protein